jgi:hypothetical protein
MGTGSVPGIEAAGAWGWLPHSHLECRGPRKSRAIPLLTLRAFVAYKKGVKKYKLSNTYFGHCCCGHHQVGYNLSGKYVVDKLYTPDYIVALWLVYTYRIITLGSNKQTQRRWRSFKLPKISFTNGGSSFLKGYNNFLGYYSVSKVNQSLYRSGQTLTVPGYSGSQISTQSAYECGKVVSPTQRPPLPREVFLALTSIRSWVDPRIIMRPERLYQWKIIMIPSGIEPATFRLVQQWITLLPNSMKSKNSDKMLLNSQEMRMKYSLISSHRDFNQDVFMYFNFI